MLSLRTVFVVLAVVALIASEADAANKKRRRRRRRKGLAPAPSLAFAVPELPKISAGKTCITVDTVTNGKCAAPASFVPTTPLFQAGRAELIRDVVSTGKTYLDWSINGLEPCEDGASCYGYAVVDEECSTMPETFYKHLENEFTNITATLSGSTPDFLIPGNQFVGTFSPTEQNFFQSLTSINYIARPEAQALLIWGIDDGTGAVNLTLSGEPVITALDDETEVVVSCCQLTGKRVKKAKKAKKTDTKAPKTKKPKKEAN